MFANHEELQIDANFKQPKDGMLCISDGSCGGEKFTINTTMINLYAEQEQRTFI